MVKIASEVTIELINAIFPAYDTSSIVAVILRSALHTRGVRSCIDGLVVPRGNPRYVNDMESVEQSKIDARSWQRSDGVLISTIVDF